MSFDVKMVLKQMKKALTETKEWPYRDDKNKILMTRVNAEMISKGFTKLFSSDKGERKQGRVYISEGMKMASMNWERDRT